MTSYTPCRVWLLLLLIVDASAQNVPTAKSSTFAPDENPRYFPAGVFVERRSDGEFRSRWYAAQLRALKEPTLSNNTSLTAETVYRFTWLRTFHHPIAVRIVVHPNGTGTLTVKMANGAGGYKPGKLTVNRTREIGQMDVQHFRNLIQAMDFWHMPTESPSYDTVGLDGAQWILEASNGGEYHVIDRWSPEGGQLHELGVYLARDLGRLDIPAKTIY